MPNAMTVTQAAAFLNAIAEQQTGIGALGAINNGADFVSAATTVLTAGNDPVINAISQIISRPAMFAVRDYNQPLGTLYMDGTRYGNAIRKLSPEAKEMEDNEAYEYPAAYDDTETDNPYGDDLSVDMYKISKQKVLQTWFQGSATYRQRYSVFREQFDVAFESAENLVSFFAMLTQERKNDRERYEEAKARALQLNYIAAILSENKAGRVIHLLTEYNTLTGQSLTATTVMLPANFEAFGRWMYSRIESLIRLFAASSEEFQTNITGYNILRHTDPDKMRVALYGPFMAMINSMVNAGVYHADILKLPTYESIEFWQSIKTPQGINFKPTYTGTNGQVVTPTNAVNNAKVIGVIHDVDALGYALLNKRVDVTPYNAAGDYWNEFYKMRFRAITDLTEKGVVLCLD